MPTEYEIEERIQQATAAARAAGGGRSPVLGRDTRTQLFVGNVRLSIILIPLNLTYLICVFISSMGININI